MEQRNTIRWVRLGDSELPPALRDAVTFHLDLVLNSWLGTKYMSGQSCKGVGADCVGFAAGVIEELYHMGTLKDRPSHSGSASGNVVRFYRRNWPTKRIRNGEVSPGDLVLCESGLGHNHLYMIGPDKNTAWHCIEEDGVTKTSVGAMTGVKAAYKLLGKETWYLPQY